MQSTNPRLTQLTYRVRSFWQHDATPWLFTTFVALLAAGCGARVEPIDPANSQTHWLEGCSSNAECGDLECLCGVCTSRCTSSTQCADLHSEATCGSGGDRCAALTSNSVCVLACDNDDDCPNDGDCDDGACSVATEPTGAQPAGAACDVDDDCASGICEGQGCDAFSGVCADEDRVCDKDARAYCGCDGVTFYGGGACPGGRYASQGECDASDGGTPVAPTLAVGESCTEDAQCSSGMCASETCFAEDARCVDITQTACLDNIVQFCGCDGVTFVGSSGGYGCAPAQYVHVGACGNAQQPVGARCDVHEDCESGICEGLGCGPFEGVCVDANRTCTEDVVSYCGCDGTLFQGSGSCPGSRVQELGACETTPTEEECAALPEATCAQTCNPIYGYKPDGSTQFVACSLFPHSSLEAYACVASADGTQVLSVPPAFIPEGWVGAPGEDCQPDCFSPFRNPELAGSGDAVGCECTTIGSACIDGVGMQCSDGTDDLNPTRYWGLAPDACDVDTDTCASGYDLQQCVDRFERCLQNGVVLDEGTPVFCGAPPLPCGQRDEAGCDGECTPQWGATTTGTTAYAGCLEQTEICEDETPKTFCIQRLTPQTLVGVGEPVWVTTCVVPSGWTELEPGYCGINTADESCSGRSEEECTEPCGVRMGRRSPDGEAEFIGCDTDDCINSKIVCAQDATTGEAVEFFGCALPGWTEVEASVCQDE